MARDIETTVVVDGDEICEIVEDHLAESEYMTHSELDDYLSNNGVLTENDAVWDLVQYDVENYVTTELGDYFSSYGNGSDRIQEHVESTLPEWLLTQLDEMPVDEEKRCALGKAFGEAVNKVITTTGTNVEWATKVEALEARVYALEQAITAMHNTWKNISPSDSATDAVRITNGLS